MRKSAIILIGFAFVPALVLAVNDVVVTGPTNFQIQTADTNSLVNIVAGTGQVTNFGVNTSSVDITLDNASAITFSATTSGLYFNVTKISGSNAYSVSSPSCPTTTVNFSGNGATAVLRLQVVTTYNCVAATSTPTSTPPQPPVSGGGGGASAVIYTPTISNFTATQSSNNVILSWNNPVDVNYGGVKIIRSTTFYPMSVTDGTLIYSGSGVSSLDLNLSYGQTYYYSAFSYNKTGGVSNALISQVYLENPEEIIPATSTPENNNNNNNTPPSSQTGGETTAPTTNPSGTSTGTGQLSSGTTTIPIGISTSTVYITNYVYSQNGKELGVSSSTINVDISQPLVITFDASKLEVPIKALVLVVTNPSTGANSSYLFNSDKNGKVFQAIISNFTSTGKYKYSIVAYGPDNKPVSTTRGSFNVGSALTTLWGIILPVLIIFLFLLILLFIIWLIIKERNKREREKVLDTWKGF